MHQCQLSKSCGKDVAHTWSSQGGQDAAVVALLNVSGGDEARQGNKTHPSPRFFVDLAANEPVVNAIDEMGKRSARAQGLKRPITVWKALQNSDHRLVLSLGQGTIRGILRLGTRQLFVRRGENSDYSQIHPVCVLDFYVHESVQRTGDGRKMFDAALEHEGLEPHQMGYDRPSNKLLAFLGRHFGLKDYTPQGNHFVVYEQYWRGGRAGARRGALRPSAFGIPCFCDHGRGSAFPVDYGRANTSPNAYTAPEHPRSPSSGPILTAR